MARWMLMPKWRSLRPRTVACTILAAVILWDSTAYAFNAIVSQDLPILTQIAATEVASHTELVAILGQASAMVASIKEYTTLAKTAWGGLDELRHMSPSQLRDAALAGVGAAFPQLRQMYSDIHDIRDLNYRDYRAVATLRGILWDEVYGPAIDYMHTGQENLDALAEMKDYRSRSQAKLAARRTEAEQWEDDCRRTAGDGEGACQAAAHRAAIQAALSLGDLQETNLLLLDTNERQIERADRMEADGIYTFDRWMFDLQNYMGAAAPTQGTCVAGRCLYEKYGDKMQQRLSTWRAQHPQPPPVRIVRSPE